MRIVKTYLNNILLANIHPGFLVIECIPFSFITEKKIKNMKCKHADLPLNEDPAAGFRK